MKEPNQILKQMFVTYKQFEKCFFRADKSKDRIAYLKHKQLFRTMMAFVVPIFLLGISMVAQKGIFLLIFLVLTVGVLSGFRTNSYAAVQVVFSIGTILTPLRYTSTSLVFATPAAILLGNSQILIQTQSTNLMAFHLAFHAVVFYFIGLERMTIKVKEMTPEELVESVRYAIIYAFIAGFINLVCMKIFYSYFSRLLRKVNTLKDDLSKVNNQLNDQNAKLHSNLEMKDVFIYTFSHELKNALNGLLGNLYLAYDTAKNTQVLQFLSSAKVCGEVLKNFVHNILDSGKLENGNLEVSLERKDVMHCMQNVWAICGRIIHNKRLQGCLKIDKNVPRFLELDEQRMIQIILNLVSNAVKFTEKGNVRLRVRWQITSLCNSQLDRDRNEDDHHNRAAANVVEREEGDALFGDMREFSDTLVPLSEKENHHLITEYHKNFITDPQFCQLNLTKSYWNHQEMLRSNLPEGSKGILKIQVVDSGCGMSSEAQSRLFQKFSQVSSLQGQRKVGAGLGLWICKELAKRLDGDITTHSVEGVGSVFELAIPTRVSRIPNNCHSRRPALDLDGTVTPPRFSFQQRAPNTLKILIADDDSFNIELMKNYLNKFGINYICAYDGEEAVSLFKKHYQEICYVITDNFMPKKTGIEAAVEIANFLEERKQPKIPVLCISGDLKVSVGERGITSVIQKPINFDRLKEELMVVYPQLTQVADVWNK